MARVGARGEKQKQILRLRASRYAQDDSRGGRTAQDDIRKALGETFVLNDRVNQLLLENLDAGALRQAQGKLWRAKPPGSGVRTIAAIFSHMHNVRRKWLRLSLPDGLRPVSPLNQKKVECAPLHLKLPAELDRMRCTQKQAAKALKESAQLCAEMIADTRVKQFVRDGWASPWNVEDAAGAMKMLAYMVSHEAHHRGQVCMLAHQMGYRLPMKVMSRMWAWERLAFSDQRSAVRKGKSKAD